MFWVALASLIISIALGVDQVYAQSLYNDRNSELSKETTNILNAISQDQSLTSQLLDAYNRKDGVLMADLLNSSPFGSRYKKIKQEYLKNKENIKESTEKLNYISSESVKAQNAINEANQKNQSTGSAVIDSIKGLTDGGMIDYKYNPFNNNKKG